VSCCEQANARAARWTNRDAGPVCVHSKPNGEGYPLLVRQPGKGLVVDANIHRMRLHLCTALVLALLATTAPSSAQSGSARRPAWTTGTTTSPAGAVGTATPPLRPLVVTHPFAPPEVEWLAGHRGVDLAGRPSQAVSAPLAGTITFVGSIGAKPVVVIDHGGFRTTYEPVSPTVLIGQQVDQGQTIGLLQLTQSHCFPQACLHWGLIVDDNYRDPLSLLGPQSVRLLPLNGQLSAGQRLVWPVIAPSQTRPIAPPIRPLDEPIGRRVLNDLW
jgi:murein DD-endopeptidase MepM/ murein hydrolase activator NlpD